MLALLVSTGCAPASPANSTPVAMPPRGQTAPGRSDGTFDSAVLTPGMTLVLEGVLRGERVVLAKPTSGTAPVLELELRLDPALGTVLRIKNPFSKFLVYHALIDSGEETLRATSTCPVRPGGFAFEQWPARIPRIVLADFILVDKPGPCK
jgi:hypothetical protein